jgi:hypothetical protein
MKEKALPEPLASILRRHCNVNAFSDNWPDALKRELNYAGDPERAALFREQLAHAILHNAITPEQYEELTGEDFDTQEELNRWLHELWGDLYGSDPLTAEGTRS